MKIVFRVRYVTVPGQSLWVKLRLPSGEHELPMHWANTEQWELCFDAPVEGAFSYTYQFREEGSGVVLDEWGEGRVVNPGAARQICCNDTWRSAATVDYAYQSKALIELASRRGPFAQTAPTPMERARFQIRVAAVPADMKVCLSGSAAALGEWDRTRAVVMEEVAADLWQVDVDLPVAHALAYKYGFCDLTTGTVHELEQGDNRELVLSAADALTWIHDEGFRRDETACYHGAGVAVPVFSLRSDDGLGVGEFADLAGLADWAAQAGMGMIQILPIQDTTSTHQWADSYPYSAISVFALHPLYLRLDDLDYPMPKSWSDDLAGKREALNGLEQVDYEAVMAAKLRLSRELFDHHREVILDDDGFKVFMTEQAGWLPAYAAFCVLRDKHGTADFRQWGRQALFSEQLVTEMFAGGGPDRRAMEYWMWLQWELDGQLRRAVAHLHERGVILKGDLPIGIDRESVEAWSAPHLFHLGSQAGAPPDAFAEKGQNWGFPTYDWERMREDGYAWWRARFSYLERYFDAFRIDHILGFFRIWQVPMDQVEGIMGWFDPAQPVHLDEFRERDIAFDYERFCLPYLTRRGLEERFEDEAQEVIDTYLEPAGGECFRMREEWNTQRKVVDGFAGKTEAKDELVCQGLLDCVSEVLFFEVPGSGGTLFHPRFFLHKTRSFQDLDERTKERVDGLYVDYFFRRQDQHWKARGLDKLPALRRASRMLLCGEDLGLVPDCVPGVMRELGILSLEIQRMPKSSEQEFGDPLDAPYLSVVSPSTHDMETLRQWWTDHPRQAQRLAWAQLGDAHPPAELAGELAERLLARHFESPAMWAVIPLQDLLAIDETLRHPDPVAERINEPAVMPHYWRYRMHLKISALAAADGLNARIRHLLGKTGRLGSSDA